MLFACVGDGTVAKRLGLAYVLKPRLFGYYVYHTLINATNPVMVVYKPNDHMGWYN